MKKIIQFKAALFPTLICIMGLLATSCGNKTETEDTKEIAEEHNEAKFDNNKEFDSQFLVNAAEVNLEEIQLSQLAQQKCTMTEVKELGVMMEKAHTKASTDLTDLASKKMITIPTSLTDNGKNAYEKLNNKKGTNFDKEYCDMMVKGHKDAIDMFEKAETKCTDPDIKQWASNMLPELRTHLDHAITCQKKCENMN